LDHRRENMRDTLKKEKATVLTKNESPATSNEGKRKGA